MLCVSLTACLTWEWTVLHTVVSGALAPLGVGVHLHVLRAREGMGACVKK